MEILELKVKTRTGHGKGPSRRTRVVGEIPAVVYGLDKAPLSITMNGKEFDHVLHGKMGEHAMLKLEVVDNPEMSGPALVKAVQHHPVRGNVIHADFMRFKMGEKIHTAIAIVMVGRCKGVVEGGVADQMLHELEIECLPSEVPANFELDITNMTFGDSVTVADLKVGDNITILTDPERTVVSVHAPRVGKAGGTDSGDDAAEEAKDDKDSK